ncbi:MFS transporter [Parvibaculum sp.]|uniref:MFS transporter n=1 Tax=Parvibaculum sp. TaxID=2024848 RepID=UPI00272FA813|nr:MFS transporter [Parvibaculum sp.]MDP1626643.1 MFS transporter [Parvibaculum sp.]MDP2150564.1 MFS transporter [Parvibaculum sp.]MDP3329555.1 MFS transporter [Parvibaculum sp.]
MEEAGAGNTAEEGRRGTSRASVPLILLGLMTFAMGQTLLFAVGGPIVREIGLSELHMGSIISLSAVAYTIAVPVWGRLSDRLGRVRPIAWGLTGYALTSLAFAGAMEAGMTGAVLPLTAFGMLIGIRMTLSLASGGIQPSATAYMADITKVENRSGGVALVGAAFGFGSVAGPLFGGLLSSFGLLVPIYASAVLALMAASVIGLFVKEPVRADTGEPKAKLKAFDARILPYVLMVLLLYVVVAILQQTSAFYFQDMFSLTSAETARNVGYAIGALAVGMLLAQGVVAGRGRLAPPVLLRAGSVIYLAALVAISLAADIWPLVAAYGALGVGAGLLTPGIMSSASIAVSADEQGAVAGVVGAGMGAAYIFGPVLGTGLYELDPKYPFMLTIALAALLLLAAWRRRVASGVAAPA